MAESAVEEVTSQFVGKFVEFRTFWQDTIQGMLQTDAKSIAWITFASNLVLLRNLICGSCAANCGSTTG